MTDALIGGLARIRALRVVSRTSVMRFKESRPSLPEIARILNVDAVIEGAVRLTGDRVRISLTLIHAATDTHVWARECERELSDALKLQDEVVLAVAEEIRIQVTAEEQARMASAGTIYPAAHEEYLLGRYHLWKSNEENLRRAIEHFGARNAARSQGTRAPRCGARTRGGAQCRAPAMRGRRRCRLHGGKSTGPGTAEGLARIRAATTTHGRYSRAYRTLERRIRRFERNGIRSAKAMRDSTPARRLAAHDLEGDTPALSRTDAGGGGRRARARRTTAPPREGSRFSGF